jgi:hypothetical protein
MLRLASDEDVHGDIVRGLWRRAPALDLVRAVDVGLGNTPDPDILAWAAAEGRVLITEDVNTMVGFAWQRVRQGQPMPGVLALLGTGGIGRAIDDILLIVQAYTADEMRAEAVIYIPLS